MKSMFHSCRIRHLILWPFPLQTNPTCDLLAWRNNLTYTHIVSFFFTWNHNWENNFGFTTITVMNWLFSFSGSLKTDAQAHLFLLCTTTTHTISTSWQARVVSNHMQMLIVGSIKECSIIVLRGICSHDPQPVKKKKDYFYIPLVQRCGTKSLLKGHLKPAATQKEKKNKPM